jgi:pSer/pThr/pTyr-binding forkhead associated (FHA) protein
MEVSLPSGRRLEYLLDAEDKPTFILGRDSEVLIEDSMVSKAHAMVFFDVDSGWKLRDLHSTNGTHLNGKRIGDDVTLSPGDVVALGQSTIGIVELGALEGGAERTTALPQWESPSKHVYLRELNIEIDQARKERDVGEILSSDFFQQLRDRVKKLRRSSE